MMTSSDLWGDKCAGNRLPIDDMGTERFKFAKQLARCGALLLPLVACASYKPVALSPARNAQSLDSRSLNNPRLEKFIAAELSAERGDRNDDVLRVRAAVHSHLRLVLHDADDEVR